jgi:hypothetical protein
MTASDLNRLRSLLRTVDRILNNDLRTQDGSGRDTTEENLRQYRNNANELIATATDDWLVAAYQQTTGELIDADAKALLVEIERRNLKI